SRAQCVPSAAEQSRNARFAGRAEQVRHQHYALVVRPIVFESVTADQSDPRVQLRRLDVSPSDLNHAREVENHGTQPWIPPAQNNGKAPLPPATSSSDVHPVRLSRRDKRTAGPIEPWCCASENRAASSGSANICCID